MLRQESEAKEGHYAFKQTYYDGLSSQVEDLTVQLTTLKEEL